MKFIKLVASLKRALKLQSGPSQGTIGLVCAKVIAGKISVTKIAKKMKTEKSKELFFEKGLFGDIFYFMFKSRSICELALLIASEGMARPPVIDSIISLNIGSTFDASGESQPRDWIAPS